MEKSDSVRRWLAEINSEISKKEYLRDLRIFCGWAERTPDQLLEERARDLASTNPIDKLKAKDRLMRFFDEGLGKRSCRSHAISALKSFYRANGMLLGMRTPKAERVRERDYIPTREDIQRMVKACKNKRDPAMIEIQAETGLRIGTLVSLRWKHLSGDFVYPSLAPKQNPIKVIIPDAITQPGVAFIYQDAAHSLRQWLLGKKLNPETLIFDIGKAAAMRVIKNMGVKAGIVKEKKGLSEFRSHCFRKRVQTILESTHVEIPSLDINGTMPLNWVDLLLDHTPRGSQGKAYSRPSEEVLRQACSFAEPMLRVF